MSREKAIEILESGSWSGYDDEEIADAVRMGAEALKEQRPHGEWIETDNRWGVGAWECSACTMYTIQRFAFCPHCGASMSKLQANGEQVKTNQWCKFKSEKNCDFCAFHSDCEIHWKDGEE